MRTDEPRAIKLSEYVPPQYEISEIHLDFALEPEKTIVKATSKIEKIGNGALVLNGEELKLVSLKIDGKDVPASNHKLADNLLTIENTPDKFTLEIVTEISPA